MSGVGVVLRPLITRKRRKHVGRSYTKVLNTWFLGRPEIVDYGIWVAIFVGGVLRRVRPMLAIELRIARAKKASKARPPSRSCRSPV